MITSWLPTTCLLFTLAAAAQQPPTPQNAPAGADGTVTFKTSTQLVIETIAVKDKSGNPVEGLTAKDFTITEDGVAQTIAFFEYQKLPEAPAGPVTTANTAAAIVNPFPKLPHTQIAPETPGDVRYRDRRLLALYFDLTAMPIPDQLRALAAAQKFVRTQMTSADLMAIMTFSSGAVQVLQDFTDDRSRLLSIIETLAVGEDENATATDAASADTGAAFGQNDAEFNIFFTDRQLSALQTAASMLGKLNEKKSLIYFASGLRLNGSNNQAQLHATINAAIRAGVSFWPIDARGLTAQAPLGDASKGSPGGQAMYTGASAMAAITNLQRTQDTLWTLGADTGGKALLDVNDLSLGIVNAQRAFSSYYIVGYYTNNANLDGKFRRIKISLREGVSGDLDYRQGYYAGKEFRKFTSSDKERQLEDALMLGDPITELTIAMEVGYFQLNNAEYFVPVVVKVSGSELALAKKGGAEHTLLDFIGEIKDEFGSTESNVRDKVDVKLSELTAAELTKRPYAYDTGFTLLPGKKVIKMLVRDAETGRIGTYQTTFTVPNLNKEEKRIAISSVVLSSQRVDMRDAVFNAAKDKTKGEIQQSVNPLVQEGFKLVPSVTRVFTRSQDMYVYLQAYQRTADTAHPLIAFVSFYRGQAKAFETPPMQVTKTLNNRLKTMPLKFSFSLQKLPPGEYTCQVTVIDPSGEKAAFWQAPVMLVQ
ncbi:MAG TPA: VWA domain-containing protein [Bryobacteraceae bacterium]|nr:VWA domain-containing protein [Bryobacteraceae bacterium]